VFTLLQLSTYIERNRKKDRLAFHLKSKRSRLINIQQYFVKTYYKARKSFQALSLLLGFTS